MKKLAAIASIVSLLALLRAEPAYALDIALTPVGGATTAFTALQSPQGVVQVGGQGICEAQIYSSAGSTGTTATIYAGVSANGTGPGKTLDAPTILMQVFDPSNTNSDNYMFGACPNFIVAEVTPLGTGTIFIKFRSKS